MDPHGDRGGGAGPNLPAQVPAPVSAQVPAQLSASAPAWVIERGSLGWPGELAAIEAPPERLWLRGRPELLAGERARIAVVGTRSPSPYGLATAQRFAAGLARAGVVVVSGLARGIDEAAHRGALDAGGDSIAVLGSGVDRPWPAGPLAERLAHEGLLLSELRPGSPARRHHFPLRNRLISGLARGVLVVEAASASGSLITARWAADQGRTVWAIPGRIDHPMAAGCHRLIREGASLIERPEEILSDLGLSSAGQPPPPPQTAPAGEAALAERLLQALQGECWTADDLAELVTAEVASVLALLVELELAGRVTRGPGGLYRLS
jgi:DNA processing protein